MESNIFVEIDKKILLGEIRESFTKKGYTVTEMNLIEYSDDITKVNILLSNGNKILVEKINNNITWKLNSLLIGNVYGKEIADVSGDCQFEDSKNREARGIFRK